MPSVYTDFGMVAGRIPYRAISASSKPSISDVQTWIDGADAMVAGTLARAGITAPTGGTTGGLILGELIGDYAEGHVRMAYAAAGGDGRNDDGKDLIEGFKATLKEILSDPSGWAAALSPAAAAPVSNLRSHVTHNSEGKEPEDYAPTFTRDDLL